MRCCLLIIVVASGLAADEPIVNPYYPRTEWRIWRLDPTPVSGVRSMKGSDGKEQPDEITVAPIPPEQRRYPIDLDPRREPGKFLRFELLPTASPRYAGCWDDVYGSWSRLHGYLRPSWKSAVTGEEVAVLDQVMHHVDVEKNRNRLGINFIHQSTTGMAHTLTNAAATALETEKYYFGDGLICSPAHASYTEEAERTRDLYLAHFPALFNSVGSSNSETMAITKMIIAGAYLRPELKLKLKCHGLYPSALLALWKAALPWEGPYDGEMHQRLAYNAVGERARYAGYGFAGSERGDACAAFHDYDDHEHLRGMVERARAMTVAPPEAILDLRAVQGGTQVYALKKGALVLQEGQPVTLTVSTAGSYDIQKRPIRVRWSLLYGDRRTTVTPAGEGSWTIVVPHDPALPEGRTALALFAHNGEQEGNPAILTVFRKRGDLPPSGGGYNDYTYPSPEGNDRPIALDLQDAVAVPGKPVEVALQAHDPEGFPLRYHLRSGTGATLDGNLLRYDCPRGTPAGPIAIPLAISDGTSGNSYLGHVVRLQVAPASYAHIEASALTGLAPLKVKFTGKGFDAKGRVAMGWAFDDRKIPDKGFEGFQMGSSVTRTFDTPGRHTALLLVEGPSGRIHTRVNVWVHAPGWAPAPLEVESPAGFLITSDDAPSTLRGTDFGALTRGQSVERRFLLHVRSGPEAPAKFTLEGAGAAAFKLAVPARKKLGAGDSSAIVLSCSPRQPGVHEATVLVKVGEASHRVAVRGELAP